MVSVIVPVYKVPEYLKDVWTALEIRHIPI